VESEYIREEILEGFDVSTVFVERDAHYYDFKPEIDTKEAIRETVGDVDSRVITQLERWWDKYRVSLNELDAQVAEAENMMRGYLEELGYE
jgi:type I restriction enzyme M protein